MSILYKFTALNEETEDVEYEVPGKYEVCWRCNGTGKHDHEAFENGLTQSDFDEDPDFREEYMRGSYDVQCSACRGLRVVVEPDEERMTQEQKAAYEQLQKWQAEEARERAWERRNRALGIEY